MAMSTAATQAAPEILATKDGKLTITHLGHGSLELDYKGQTVQVDPYSQVADYATRPKADLVLITHDHYDHLDKKALAACTQTSTVVVASESAAAQLTSATIVLKNGDETTQLGIKIQAVPAYNLVNNKPDGTPFHPKGYGNGYVLTFADKTLYIAGDTEDIPELEKLKGKIDIAFLPKNLPYTMDDDMFIRAAKMLQPKILFPYHYSEINIEDLKSRLKDTSIQLKTSE